MIFFVCYLPNHSYATCARWSPKDSYFALKWRQANWLFTHPRSSNVISWLVLNFHLFSFFFQFPKQQKNFYWNGMNRTKHQWLWQKIWKCLSLKCKKLPQINATRPIIWVSIVYMAEIGPVTNCDLGKATPNPIAYSNSLIDDWDQKYGLLWFKFKIQNSCWQHYKSLLKKTFYKAREYSYLLPRVQLQKV